MAKSKTGGGRGTNQHQVRGRSTQQGPDSPAEPSAMDALGASDVAAWFVDEGGALSLVGQLASARLVRGGVVDATGVASNTDPKIRRLAAEHPRTLPDTLEQLSQDQDVRVRQAVARNPAAPESALMRLGQDKNWAVRLSAIANRRAPNELLEQALGSEVPMERVAAAENPSLPVARLRRLAQEATSAALLQSIAKNFNAPADVLASLAQHPDVRVRVEVASNFHTPPDVLELLSHDADVRVRMWVARHPHTPIGVLEELSKETIASRSRG